MTTGVVRAGPLPATRSLDEPIRWLALSAGCIALAARPVSSMFLAITVVIGFVGIVMPARSERDDVRSGSAYPLLLGIAAFAAARGLLGGAWVPPATGWLFASAMVAAVSEEAFFRRYLYDMLDRYGAAAAMLGSSVVFGAVHVPVWGWRALPVDIAAGLLFAWQRHATGSWIVPAATHLVANVLMLL